MLTVVVVDGVDHTAGSSLRQHELATAAVIIIKNNNNNNNNNNNSSNNNNNNRSALGRQNMSQIVPQRESMICPETCERFRSSS